MIHSFQAMQALSHPPGESTDLCSGIPCQGAGLCLVLVRAWDQCLVMSFFPLQSPVISRKHRSCSVVQKVIGQMLLS